MQLDHILEAAGLDEERVVEHARREGATGPLVVAGSLVDGLGMRLSDVDLVCFDRRSRLRPHEMVAVQHRQWGRLTVDLHSVNVTTFRTICAPYREWLLAAPAEPIGRIPYDALVLLHALHSGRPLDGGAELDELRTAVGSDLYPMLLALRALGRFLHCRRDAGQLLQLGLERAGLAAARNAVEAVTDAALAAVGAVNPHPKWRVPLVHRAARDAAASWLPWGQLQEALFADGPGTQGLLAVADTVAAAVAEYSPLAMYWESRAIEAAIDAPRACSMYSAHWAGAGQRLLPRPAEGLIRP